VIGCAKQSDLNEVNNRLDGIENRVGVLEDAVKQLNEKDIPSLQSLVRAIQNNITVTSVVETENGYVLTFSDGTTATLRNGKDGNNGRDGVDGVDGIDGKDGKDGVDGKDGKDGKDGTTPVIGITLVDGVYVWTVNGSILKDEAGNPLPVSGNDGTDGTDGITPLFGILDGHWVVSYDNGDTWKTLGLTSDTDYSAYLDPEKETDDYIVLVVGATEVQIPKEKAFTLVFPTIENNGVKAGETAAFPYTIAGVNSADETDVDVIGIIGDWTAEVVPTDNASGVLNVTATTGTSAKITVYAANHKGKADIRTLKFEDGILEAVIETHDIEWEGGKLDLAVTTNLAYDIFVPAAAEEWITVASTRVRTDNFEIVVAKNETGAYRTATLQVVDENGKSVKDIEILQYANPEVATDLASVVALPDDKAVLVNAVTVVAASKTSTIITDGEAFSYVAGYTGTPGTVIDIEGTKKTDDYGLGYIEPAEVTVNSEAEPAEINNKDYYAYYGAGGSYFYTAVNGTLEEKDGACYMAGLEEPQQFVIETPTQDVSALVGKQVAMSGWVKTVDKEYGVKEDIVIVATDIREIVFAEEAGWKPYYSGAIGDDPDYPEILGNEVANPQDDVFYTLAAFPEEAALDYSSMDDFITASMYQISDNLLFSAWYYNLLYGMDFDSIFSILAHNESAEEEWSAFDFGKYYLFAVGLDTDGRLTGKYAVTTFEKESPYTAAAYEDFLGEWTYTSASGSETWTIKEKENGKTYTIEGIAKGAVTNGGGVPVAEYDAENGTMTISQQTLGSPWTYDYQGMSLVFTDYLTSAWYSGGNPKDNSSYMLDPLICTAMKDKNDGHIDLIPSEDEYGPLEGIGFFADSPDGYTWNYYAASKLPGKLTKGAQEMDPNYAKWLGTWEIERQAMAFNGTEWVSSGDPVTDKWTIAEDTANESFTITGFYGKGDSFPVIASFDAASGEISVATQDVGPVRFQGDDYDCEAYLYGGLLYSNGSNYRISGNYTIFTAKMSGDNAANLAPGTVTIPSLSSDPLALSFARFYAADPKDGKYYTFDDKALATLPNTMRRASTAGAQSMGNAPAVRAEASVMAISGTNTKNGSLTKDDAHKRDAKPAPARKSGTFFKKAVKF
jgi:hypothetical protein